jgi:hypothetical protein
MVTAKKGVAQMAINPSTPLFIEAFTWRLLTEEE